MRSDGNGMIVGIKDTAKLIGIMIIVCCAVFVCTLFLNYNIDIAAIRDKVVTENAMLYYQAQVSTGRIVSAVSGGCLLATSVIMLLFYIKHDIDVHKKELGILKAIGYSAFYIAKRFWVFGSSVLIGAAFGFSGAFLLMPSFYAVQNADQILPEFSAHFHPMLAVYLILLPAAFFSGLANIYAYRKLKRPVLELLQERQQAAGKVKRLKARRDTERPFVEELKRSTLSSRKTLVFFIAFASFCFSSMTQMSFGMNELASPMMAVIIILIGLILACTTLFLAVTAVIHDHTKTVAMMRVFGYSHGACCRAILGGYRPAAYIGFLVGSFYQYILLKIMVSIVFREIENVPEYGFDFPAMMLSLVSFAVLYEGTMYFYAEKIKRISVKEIMLA